MKTKKTKTILFAAALILIAALMVGCQSEKPSGKEVVWPKGHREMVTVGNVSFAMDVEEVGSDGIRFKEVPKLFQPGDKIVRELPGEWLEFGQVISIDGSQVTVFWYHVPELVSPPAWAEEAK